jgi:hypothetical protein
MMNDIEGHFNHFHECERGSKLETSPALQKLQQYPEKQKPHAAPLLADISQALILSLKNTICGRIEF